MKKIIYVLVVILLTSCASTGNTQAVPLGLEDPDNPELIIGEYTSDLGVVFIFEGAIKDTVYHGDNILPENETDVHLEGRVNWAPNAITASVDGGFVPYLHIEGTIINEKTNEQISMNLLPHINLVDNFHYALNTKLPGKKDDSYTVIFTVSNPEQNELLYHYDFVQKYSNANNPQLISEPLVLEYNNIDFFTIANATRKR